MDDRPVSAKAGTMWLIGIVATPAIFVLLAGALQLPSQAGIVTCSIALTILAATACGIFLVARSGKQAQQRGDLTVMLLGGAFDIERGFRKSHVVRLSYLIARHFHIRRSPDDPAIHPETLTLGDISTWVYERLQWEASVRNLVIDGDDVERIRQCLAKYGPAEHFPLCGNIAEIAKGLRLRRAWNALQAEFARPLPGLELSWPMRIVAGAIGLAATFGLVIPLVSALDTAASGRANDNLAVFGIFIRLGFFVVLAIFSGLSTYIVRVFFGRPQEPCESLGLVAGYLVPSIGRTTFTWTPELVWRDVQAIAGIAYGTMAGDLPPETPLVRSVGMPVITNDFVLPAAD